MTDPLLERMRELKQALPWARRSPRLWARCDDCGQRFYDTGGRGYLDCPFCNSTLVVRGGGEVSACV